MKELSLAEARAIPIRGHTLLCLQGFRGEGYSAGFIANLSRIHRALREHPEQWVEVVEAPDTVCEACPHRAPAGCGLHGEGSEEGMQRQDRQVLALLGLQPGTRVRWSEVLGRIRASITGASLPGICGQCPWLPLGYCRDGIDTLKSQESNSIREEPVEETSMQKDWEAIRAGLMKQEPAFYELEPGGALLMDLGSDGWLLELTPDGRLLCQMGMDLEEIKSLMSDGTPEDLGSDEVAKQAKYYLQPAVAKYRTVLRGAGFQETFEMTEEYVAMTFQKTLDVRNLEGMTQVVRWCRQQFQDGS